MRLLICNDDGYQAAGIRMLAEALGVCGDIEVVAPDRNCSAASHSLTLSIPLRAHRQDDGYIAVEGTPTDCVHLALNGLLDELPEMVVSGINNGPNMGDDVLYSGTVAGAIEGRFLGLPSIAISMECFEPKHYETAGKVAVALVEQLQRNPLPADSILNVNVPDRPWEQLQGFRATRLGHRHKAEPLLRQHDPRGNPVYWVGPAGPEADAGPGTDFHAVKAGYVSVTPLQIDLTRHAAVEAIGDWLEGCQ